MVRARQASSQLATPPKRSKATTNPLPTPEDTPVVAASKLSPAKAKKFAQLESLGKITPFPDWSRPTPEECQAVHDLLSQAHGTPERPKVLVDVLGGPAGCGEVPSVLDALVRTCLSANTTSKNSTRAKENMDEVYGRANYRAVLEGGIEKLKETIKVAGLKDTKGKAIYGILQSADEKVGGKGELSLNHLHEMSDLEAMRELISYEGVGMKTASCVLLFCLQRESIAVDTHVLRLSKSLGWLPEAANAETAFQHLEVRVPNHLKYGLHTLFVRHGRGCEKCSAGTTTMCFVDWCPIDHLVARKKKKAGKRVVVKKEGVAVKDEQADMDADEVQEDKVTASPSAAARRELEKRLVDAVGIELAPDQLVKELEEETAVKTEESPKAGSSRVTPAKRGFFVEVPGRRTRSKTTALKPETEELAKEALHGF